MASAKICDRCKKTERDASTDGWSSMDVMLNDRHYQFHRNEPREKHMDLCTNCTVQLLAFLKEPVSLT